MCIDVRMEAVENEEATFQLKCIHLKHMHCALGIIQLDKEVIPVTLNCTGWGGLPFERF